MAFEQQLASENRDLDQLRQALAIDSEATKMPRAPRFRRNIGTLLCTALSAYRLLDVMYAIQHPKGLQVNPSYPRCRTNEHLSPSSVRDFYLGFG